jgi:hypothetical protein
MLLFFIVILFFAFCVVDNALTKSPDVLISVCLFGIFLNKSPIPAPLLNVVIVPDVLALLINAPPSECP